MYASHSWNVIVIGGGHSGCEAALAAARKGCRTLLLTLKRDSIGVMSCNPAIGGIGKGQLVCEIDAMGGMMGLAADYACIQYRLLNRRKGAAVHGPRGQEDRSLYKQFVQRYLQKQPNLEIVEGECADLIIKNHRCTGVITADQVALHADAVVLTTGTFLRGMIYQGKKRYAAGRQGEKAADLLSAKLIDHGLLLGRLKTGTPPRLYRHSINYDALTVQPADTHPRYFSLLTHRTQQKQVDCHITHTQASTHDIIRKNLDFSPVYQGEVTASGPRYCPSIEDKIHRFADKSSHQIFLEPEGLHSNLVYPNGISTSLSIEAQKAFLHTIPGLENVDIAQYGYTIEYDFIDPQNLTRDLAVRNIDGLFLAGQINGSTGYEEAAAQGLIAGLNAANKSLAQMPFYIARYQGYIGVMVDDMTQKGVSEPYRMFTSRAEFRLQLRSDNAPHRLCTLAREQNCLDDERWTHFQAKHETQQKALVLLEQYSASPHTLKQAGIHVNHDGAMRNAKQLLANQVPFEQLLTLWPALADIDADTREFVWNTLRYAHYSQMQEREIERLRREETMILPANTDYLTIDSLSHEVRQILHRKRPTTLGEAAKLQGITPSALVHLMILVETGKIAAHTPLNDTSTSS